MLKMQGANAVAYDRTQEIKNELALLGDLKAKAKEHRHNLSKMKAGRHSRGNEYEIQERLENYFMSNKKTYARESKAEDGRIDFITDDRIYEVKKIWNKQDLFTAIGQLTYYNRCHRDKYILVLCSDSFTPKQEAILKTLNIESMVI